jgi:threonine aldolase
MFCLSKGLCAPVGSLLAGKRSFVDEARLKRKIMGGGMRQAGILAAAGILALSEQTGHLAEDHEKARKIARELAEIPRLKVNPWRVDINMTFVEYQPASEPETAGRITEGFKKRGILINPAERGLFRFVTHYGIRDADVDKVIAAARELFV